MNALTLQQLAGAAERLENRRVLTEAGVNWLSLLDSARDRLQQQPFRAERLPAYRRNRDSKQRLICNVPPVERLIEEAMIPVLHRRLEHLLPDGVHAWRPGRGTLSAASSLSHALQAGQYHLALMDIRDFFGCIPRPQLLRLLRGQFPPAMVDVLSALVTTPLLCRGRLIRLESGIPLGRPVSPLLANLYLAPLDQAMARTPASWLRYGDDLLLAARTRDELCAATGRLAALLAHIGLTLADEKTRILLYEGEPVPYLGRMVTADGVFERMADTRLEKVRPGNKNEAEHAGRQQPNRRGRSLYINDNHLYLSIRDQQIVVRRNQEELRRVPLRSIDRVLLLGTAAMSSGFIEALIARRIPLHTFSQRGGHFGALVPDGLPNPLRLRAQYDLLRDPERRLGLARTIVTAKLAAMLRRLRPVSAAEEQRKALERLLPRVAEMTGPDALRRLEGRATVIYYRGWKQRIRKPDFAFKTRSRRPPRDPVNSLLSFSYSLLFREMLALIVGAGLDPSPALLHELDSRHPALVSDLMEPYRVLIADSFVLTMINTGQVKADGFFRQSGGAVYMTKDQRRDIIPAWEHFMTRNLGAAKGSRTPRQILESAADAYLALTLGEADQLQLSLGEAGVEAKEGP